MFFTQKPCIGAP